ncbi:MAG: hypothetical protein ACAI35_19350 [Candidatus Methylacidiphilales bacterium]|nr:hypothetical protein [Candidatus Methylacidiphilales bacterium]
MSRKSLKLARARNKLAGEEFSKAGNLVIKAFKELQVSRSMPDWFIGNVDAMHAKTSINIWTFSYFLYKKCVLKEGEYWHINKNGSKMLVFADGSVLINGTPDNYEKVFFFEIDVNVDTGECTIVKETDLATVNKDDFELYINRHNPS